MNALVYTGLYLIILLADYLPGIRSRGKKANILYAVLLLASIGGLFAYGARPGRFTLTGWIEAALAPILNR